MDVLDRIDPRLCVQCKAARGLCGIDPCPLLRRVQSHLPKVKAPSKDLWGSSPPSLFVGRHGYPNVSVGPMLPPEHLPDERAAFLDSPGRWMDELRIPDVVGLRSSLVRTVHKVRVHDAMGDRADRITRLSQELAVAARPVDTEVHLRRIPSFSATHVTEFTAPHGPVVEVERAALGENVRVERRMEAVTSDTDLRASDALAELYRTGTDPYQLERVLSAGMVGMARNRRLVPTRWAITATDDTLGKALIDTVRDLPTLDKPTVHRGGGFGNHFLVLLVPRVWGFDNIEVWSKGSFWAQADGVGGAAGTGGTAGADTASGAGGAGGADGAGETATHGKGGRTTTHGTDRGTATHEIGVPVSTFAAASPPASIPANDWEDHNGRSAYAINTTGGYYATRLAALEHLVAIGRQATVVALREITDEYTTPLGVWVVREACRRALAAPGLPFEDLPSALRHMDRHARTPDWQHHAGLLDIVRRQRTLDAWV